MKSNQILSTICTLSYGNSVSTAAGLPHPSNPRLLLRMRVKFRILLVKLSLALFPRRWSKDIRRRSGLALALPLTLVRTSIVFVNAGPAVIARGSRRPKFSLSKAMSIVPEDSRGEAEAELENGNGGGGGGVLRCWSSGRIGG